MNYDYELEKTYHPENFTNSEFADLLSEAQELFPELEEAQLIEVVENFMEARQCIS